MGTPSPRRWYRRGYARRDSLSRLRATSMVAGCPDRPEAPRRSVRRAHRVRHVVPRRPDRRPRGAGARGRARPAGGRRPRLRLARGRHGADARGGARVPRRRLARHGEAVLAARRPCGRGDRRDAAGRALVVPHRQLHLCGGGDRRAARPRHRVAPVRGRGGARRAAGARPAGARADRRRRPRLADRPGSGAQAARRRVGRRRALRDRAAAARLPRRGRARHAGVRAAGRRTRRGACRRARHRARGARSRRDTDPDAASGGGHRPLPPADARRGRCAGRRSRSDPPLAGLAARRGDRLGLSRTPRTQPARRAGAAPRPRCCSGRCRRGPRRRPGRGAA